jgi:hypothetical protein
MMAHKKILSKFNAWLVRHKVRPFPNCHKIVTCLPGAYASKSQVYVITINFIVAATIFVFDIFSTNLHVITKFIVSATRTHLGAAHTWLLCCAFAWRGTAAFLTRALDDIHHLLGSARQVARDGFINSVLHLPTIVGSWW